MLTGCGEDTLNLITCIDAENIFDIEEVSVLQDAVSTPGMHDAIILDHDPSTVPEGGSWRVGEVEVLVMVSSLTFDFFPEDAELTIEVFDADIPLQTTPYILRQTVNKNELDWTDVTLDNPDSAFLKDQKQAWMKFNFSDVIPESGMLSDKFIVGVFWHGIYPSLGYSNYNRRCDLNWTDYDDGSGWVLNGNNGTNTEPTCNWPMLRVAVETISLREKCD